eukprot:358100-Rhodomonas_salina.1
MSCMAIAKGRKAIQKPEKESKSVDTLSLPSSSRHELHLDTSCTKATRTVATVSSLGVPVRGAVQRAQELHPDLCATVDRATS